MNDIISFNEWLLILEAMPNPFSWIYLKNIKFFNIKGVYLFADKPASLNKIDPNISNLNPEDMEDKYWGAFKPYADKKYDFAFTYGNDTTTTIETNKNEPFKLMSTVIDIFTDFVHRYDGEIDAIRFSGWDSRRMNLYKWTLKNALKEMPQLKDRVTMEDGIYYGKPALIMNINNK